MFSLCWVGYANPYPRVHGDFADPWRKSRRLFRSVLTMRRLARSVLAALFVAVPLTTAAGGSSPASAVVLSSGMTLSGMVEPASASSVVKGVSLSAQDGESGMAMVTTSDGKTLFSFHFKVAGPGTVTWRVATNVGSYSGNISNGRVNLSTTGGMARPWNLCQRTCSEPVARPMER